MKVTIYTDGAARGNPDGPGGYGTVLQYIDQSGTLHEREYSAGYKKTTNNRMELMAAIIGLEALNRPCEVDLYSDSQYLVKAFNDHWIDGWLKNNWKNSQKKAVKNVDLWKRLLAANILSGLRDMRDIRKTNAAISWQQLRRTAQTYLTMFMNKW